MSSSKALPACPRCKAPAGTPCRVASGKATRPHAERMGGNGADPTAKQEKPSAPESAATEKALLRKCLKAATESAAYRAIGQAFPRSVWGAPRKVTRKLLGMNFGAAYKSA